GGSVRCVWPLAPPPEGLPVVPSSASGSMWRRGAFASPEEVDGGSAKLLIQFCHGLPAVPTRVLGAVSNHVRSSAETTPVDTAGRVQPSVSAAGSWLNHTPGPLTLVSELAELAS